jgi:trimeric autotransporter adhesin
MATITITGDNNANVLTGPSASDRYLINGLGGNDTLTGNVGDDVLDGGTGNDIMRGGSGADVYKVDSAFDDVDEVGNGTVDRVEASVTWSLAPDLFVENLTLTGVANINGTGNALNNIIIGNAGNNDLNGGIGADTMEGKAGNDSYHVDNVGDVVVEAVGGGTDWVYSTVTHTLSANVENLDLDGAGAINGTGNALANIMYGNDANNVLNGLGGVDTMTGWLGNDSYYVDSSLDVASENFNSGIDKVFSSTTNYTLGANIENMLLLTQFFAPSGVNGTGNSLANTMEGNLLGNQLNGMGGNDLIYGYGGNDTIDGGTGDDHMHGDAGDDVIRVDSVNDIVHEFVGEGTDRVDSSVSFTISDNIENLTLTGVGNISGTGNASVNVITGNSGNNYLNGAAGADTLVGGLGTDTYIVDNAADTVVEAANAGSDWIYASVTETLALNVENLLLTGAAAINGTGNTSANSLYGNSAANVLMGLAGDDVIIGQGGNDTLQGGTGADTIYGGTGIDILRAVDNVPGDDFAEDRFVFNTALNGFTNVDSIDRSNFTQGGGEGVDDQIELDNFIFTNLFSTAGTNSGSLGASYYFEGTSSGNGLFDSVGIYNNTTTGELFYNPSFGVANDSTLFADVNVGGSAVLSAEEFTLS